MNNLRILLIEDDPGRVERLLSLFAAAEHPPVCVPTAVEAAEALSVQKFDVALFTSSEPAKELTHFAVSLRASDARENADSRIAVFTCFPEHDSLSHSDGYLPDDFTAGDLEKAFVRFQGSIQPVGAPRGTAPAQLATFEPAEFEEQCVHDSELMLEIIGLFFEECRDELPQMGEALAEGDFEGLARLAHKIKGSLASLQAPLARSRAQLLESAAKDRNFAVCSETLFALEEDLALLNRSLETFRDTCLCR
jgi:HPt (histidine-containing phosphotransfer) domain-containing protein